MTGRERKGKKKTKQRPTGKRTVAFVGAGKLASSLAPALAEAGFRITEIVARNRTGSIRRAQRLAGNVGARAVTLKTAAFSAELLWLAVPDGEIRGVAELVAKRVKNRGRRFFFHSSGALGSGELEPLRKAGLAIASVHPLMTFVADSRPGLSGVTFAIEGDAAALRKARSLVRALGAQSFVLAHRHKVAYHAWATMASPLLLAYLVTLEEAANRAGVGPGAARAMSLPIMRQTVENYFRLGPANSFSGPFIRGDLDTVRKHLTLMKRNSKVKSVYVALARVALEKLPVRNRQKLFRLLQLADSGSRSLN